MEKHGDAAPLPPGSPQDVPTATPTPRWRPRADDQDIYRALVAPRRQDDSHPRPGGFTRRLWRGLANLKVRLLGRNAVHDTLASASRRIREGARRLAKSN